MKRGSWPTLLGYFGTTPYSNIGEVDNKGIELSLNWRKEIIKDLNVDLRANLTYNKINMFTTMNRIMKRYGRKRLGNL